MSVTIEEVIKSVFRALEQQGITLPLLKYHHIEEEANKIIDNLIKLKKKEEKVFARFTVDIPCDINKASLRNRTIREFIKAINPSVELEFELSKNTLTLCDSYEVFDGKISTFPCHMRVSKKDNRYFYNYEED